jgi:hypothetical protein
MDLPLAMGSPIQDATLHRRTSPLFSECLGRQCPYGGENNSALRVALLVNEDLVCNPVALGWVRDAGAPRDD